MALPWVSAWCYHAQTTLQTKGQWWWWWWWQRWRRQQASPMKSQGQGLQQKTQGREPSNVCVFHFTVPVPVLLHTTNSAHSPEPSVACSGNTVRAHAPMSHTSARARAINGCLSNTGYFGRWSCRRVQKEEIVNTRQQGNLRQLRPCQAQSTYILHLLLLPNTTL